MPGFSPLRRRASLKCAGARPSFAGAGSGLLSHSQVELGRDSSPDDQSGSMSVRRDTLGPQYGGEGGRGGGEEAFVCHSAARGPRRAVFARWGGAQRRNLLLQS